MRRDIEECPLRLTLLPGCRSQVLEAATEVTLIHKSSFRVCFWADTIHRGYDTRTLLIGHLQIFFLRSLLRAFLL